MFNKLIIIGNLTKDLDLKFIPKNNSSVANGSIASTYKYKSNNTEQKEEVCFLDFTLFGRSAEIANQYLKKGSKVLLEGRLIYETWTGSDGKPRSKHSLRVETMKMFSNSNDKDIETTNTEETVIKPILKSLKEDNLSEIPDDCPF